jgi:predicted AAA+ superfamily ATPase
MKKKFHRSLNLPNNHSLFLFGARNTGKSTLVKEVYAKSSIIIDLLKKSTEARFTRNPDELYDIVMGLPKKTTHVIIDEIQKNPKLLDVVHTLMGETKKYFILTGSSARKLKQGGANLLAGRAFVYHMYPLTHVELGNTFNLEQALHWGTLPEIFTLDSDDMKKEFLYAYAHTYLKEEIWNEHFIKDLDPFRRFLEVAAQCNGKLINFSNVARDVGVSDKTIQSYYSILEDTLVVMNTQRQLIMS